MHRFVMEFQLSLPEIAEGQGDDEAAWRTRRAPGRFVVTEKDRMVSPDLQRATAQQIGATVVKVDASHMPMLSKPTEGAAAIIDAARTAR
jgi:pimeloyl-ACP methyl ester carboxylesterase